MKRAFVLVEGQTEETFIRDILAPHFAPRGLHLQPVSVCTKRIKAGGKYRGGVINYRQVERDLRPLLNDSKVSVVTTMIDYYRLPKDFPGMEDLAKSDRPKKQVRHLEKALEKEIDDQRFLAYFSLHEFEALLFADPKTILDAFPKTKKRNPLGDLSPQPEKINDGKTTHPAARIESAAGSYRKALHGPIIAKRIGLQKMRSECPHFAKWIKKLESIAS